MTRLSTHDGDQQKEAEHEAVMALVPVEDATHTAVQSGAWSETSTWGGSVPNASSNVVIPEGKAVTVDTTTAQAKWVRVDGKLDFSIATNTTLTAETIVVALLFKVQVHSVQPQFSHSFWAVGPPNPAYCWSSVQADSISRDSSCSR